MTATSVEGVLIQNGSVIATLVVFYEVGTVPPIEDTLRILSTSNSLSDGTDTVLIDPSSTTVQGIAFQNVYFKLLQNKCNKTQAFG